SLGAGFRGGPVFPAIFLAIALATFACVWFDVSPTLAVAIGTAAGTAAVTRLLVTASLFATLLVGTAGIDAVPPAARAAPPSRNRSSPRPSAERQVSTRFPPP